MEETSETATKVGTVLVVSGPSGAGKTSVCRAVLDREPRLHFSVSCTTRAPRPGEKDGSNYYFLDRREFEERVAAGCFLEHAEVHGNLYGTLRDEVERFVLRDHDVLLDIDVQGADQIRESLCGSALCGRAVFVFLGPPSFTELERRLRGRETEPQDVVVRRLTNARVELSSWRRYDYLVVNEQLPRAVQELQSVLHAARCASSAFCAAPWE